MFGVFLFSPFFFFSFFLNSITPGAAYHSLQLLLHFGDKSLFVPTRGAFQREQGPHPSHNFAVPSPKTMFRTVRLPSNDSQTLQKSDPKPHLCPSPPPALLLPRGVRGRCPASRPLPWVETTYKWLNSDVMPSSA